MENFKLIRSGTHSVWDSLPELLREVEGGGSARKHAFSHSGTGKFKPCLGTLTLQ